jgi:hypothetical protein
MLAIYRDRSYKQSRTQHYNAESTRNRADKKKDNTEGIEIILSDVEDSKLPLPCRDVEFRGAPSSRIPEGEGSSSSDTDGGFGAFNLYLVPM